MCNFKNTLKKVIQQHDGEFAELREGVIPQIIHRIWLGNAMPDATFQTLQHFQEHMNQTETEYVHVLWVYPSEEDLPGDLKVQTDKLKEHGMIIRAMPAVWEARPEIKKALEQKINKGKIEPSEYKIASDIFRMYILLIEGGIYMDVDIGVREELFAEPIFHRFQLGDGLYMPLLGSVSPFVDLFQEAGGDMEVYMAREYNAYILHGGYAWNYFFASVPENPVIERMLGDVCNGDGQSMTANLVENFFAQIQGTDVERKSALFDYAFAPLDLQYYTEASVTK